MKRVERRALLSLLPAGAAIMLLGIAPLSARADVVPPSDTYQVTAGSAVVDQRGYETGSPVDPLPAENTALANTSVTADSSPSSAAHAASLEPPASAQALTTLNNVPAPYPTQANAICSGCESPQSQSSDTSFDRTFDTGRAQAAAVNARANADLYSASGLASLQQLSAAPVSQFLPQFALAVAALQQALAQAPFISCLSQAAIALPTAPAVALPSSSLLPARSPSASPNTACTSAASTTPFLAQSATVSSQTTVVSDDTGTHVDTYGTAHGTALLNGLITVGAVKTEVTAASNGTSDTTTVSANTTIANVCAGATCNLQITATGICSAGTSVSACANDPINQQLRQFGFNVCRLGDATSGSGTTTVSGTAAGILVEWHAGLSGTPDPAYYSTQLCSPDAPSPAHGFSGFSAYVVVGESSAQLQAAPASAATQLPSAFGFGFGGGGFGGVGGSSFGSGGNSNASAPVSVFGINVDRRLLYLAVFAVLELTLLYNMTMLARSRLVAT